MLLRQLYGDTPSALEGGLESLNREQREDEAKRALRERAGRLGRRAICGHETARHYAPYWQGLTTDTQAVFARLLLGLRRRRDPHRPAPRRRARRDPRLLCAGRPSRHLLAPRRRAWRWWARTWSTRGPIPRRTATRRPSSGSRTPKGNPTRSPRLPRLRADDRQDAEGRGGGARGAEGPRQGARSANASSAFRPISSSTTKDPKSTRSSRSTPATGPALLYDLTRTLAANNIYIASAVIATYGAQVVDTFYVKDMFGLKLHPKTPAGSAGTQAARRPSPKARNGPAQ